MPSLKAISATAFKGPSFSHDLGPVNVIVGRNYSQKTAVLQAVQLALLGWVPGLARTNQGIFSLASGPVLEVEAVLSDGRKLTRSFVEKKGTIQASHMVPAGFKVPDVLMDAGEYLRLSDRERLKYVFGLVDISASWSGETILKTVAQTPIDCDKEIVEAVVLARKVILDRLTDSDMARHDADEPVQGWLEREVMDLREKTKMTTAALGRMEKYSQASVELKSADSGDQANVDRLLKDKRAALQEASNALAIAKQKKELAQRDAGIRKELEHRLTEPFDAKAIEITRKQIADLEAGHVKVIDLGNLAFKVAEARGVVEAARTRQNNVLTEFETLEAKHSMDMKEPKCPHCGTGGKKFKDAIKKHYDSRYAELKTLKVEADEAVLKATDAYKQEQAVYEKAALADKKAQTDRLLIQSLKAEVARLETLAVNRATWQKQLDGLGKPSSDQADLGSLQAAINTLTNQVNDLADQQKRWVAAAHEAKRQAEAMKQRQTLEAELVALKAIVKALEAVQEQMISDGFSKILEDANRFTDGILLTPLSYHQQDIGRWSGCNWITHRSFSGTESLLCGAAISIALCRQSPIKLTLLDEIGRLEISNKRKLVNRLIELTGNGFIDQAILVDVSTEPYASIDGIQVISL